MLKPSAPEAGKTQMSPLALVPSQLQSHCSIWILAGVQQPSGLSLLLDTHLTLKDIQSMDFLRHQEQSQPILDSGLCLLESQITIL